MNIWMQLDWLAFIIFGFIVPIGTMLYIWTTNEKVYAQVWCIFAGILVIEVGIFFIKLRCTLILLGKI